ncbi:MAG: DUF1385 domain-containing protein [Candidatus Latescibacteria bacterium]|nr:DUF1385 domain-containing protein [Candidatus Latescibacterota bacterium]
MNEVKEEVLPPETVAGCDDGSVDMNVGGQAVIEGVMMRSPTAIATAVRLPDGAIEIDTKPFTSFVKVHTFLDVPVLRGAVNFFEMLVIGVKTLNWSADVQMQYEDRRNGRETGKKSLVNSLMLGGSIVLAFVIALGVFFALPIWAATLLGLSKGALLFNLVAGSIRLALFLLYVFLISRMPDVKRIFRYHGAEHKSIFAFESSLPLVVESARSKSRFHPRCGTSFILIVALFSIFLYGIADSLFPLVFGHMQSYPERLVTHLSLLPLVAGVSYELLKLSGKFRSNRLARALIAPGLWLQKMTTAVPDDDMLEVALCALSAAIEYGESAT